MPGIYRVIRGVELFYEDMKTFLVFYMESINDFEEKVSYVSPDRKKLIP